MIIFRVLCFCFACRNAQRCPFFLGGREFSIHDENRWAEEGEDEQKEGCIAKAVVGFEIKCRQMEFSDLPI